MLRTYLLAAACVAGVAGAAALTPVFAAESGLASLSTDDQAKLDARVAAAEQLVISYADDFDGLVAAVEAFITGDDDPKIAAHAVIVVLTQPGNETVKRLLVSNPALKDAMGRGLGAAIAGIGLTDPVLAATLQAKVVQSGDVALASAVISGTESKTASLQQHHLQQQRHIRGKGTTPENPASPS